MCLFAMLALEHSHSTINSRPLTINSRPLTLHCNQPLQRNYSTVYNTTAVCQLTPKSEVKWLCPWRKHRRMYIYTPYLHHSFWIENNIIRIRACIRCHIIWLYNIFDTLSLSVSSKITKKHETVALGPKCMLLTPGSIVYLVKNVILILELIGTLSLH